MEDIFSDNKLGELESKIDVLLQSYQEMKSQKGNITGRLESLENENRLLKEQVAKIEDEKNVILHKVKVILDKIQKIEV